MSEQLRVLLVEDLEGDAALMVRLLEKSAYTVYAERVEDAGAMREALANRKWDVILADYRLPNFDGPAALRILRETGEDLPFIIVSASIGEALAVELMRSGAHDYIMKSNMARLAPAVEREIREARVRRERRQAEERLAFTIQATQIGTFDFCPQTGELVWSAMHKQQFGLRPEAPVSYETFLRGIHPDDRERIDRQVREGVADSAGQFSTEFRVIGIEDGVERWLSSKGRIFFDPQGQPARLVGVTLDITKHKHLEDQFLQAQKLESIGRLAGGVAHDFNNLLTIIGGYSKMIADELGAGHPLLDAADEIRLATDRAAALTRQLLTFSRRQVSEPKNIRLNDLVADLENMLRRLIGENIELVLSLNPDAGVLHADPGHIEQVLLNLVVNAKDAMPFGGRLLITTGGEVVDAGSAGRSPALTPNTYVTLAVSDTGAGMSPEVKAHIFEPFFTTKPKGKGTGLGLSTVYGIVTQCDGAIWVSSEPGRGTCFRMLFPAVDAEPDSVAAETRESSEMGHETVLVAEDEPGVRDFIRITLTRRGYKVLAAPNGREALSLLCRKSGHVQLVMADVVMPEMGGVELAGEVGTRYPDVPVLLMSGYPEGLQNRERLPAHYIQKPFTSATLLTSVRALLHTA
jgi:hypothetical protein